MQIQEIQTLVEDAVQAGRLIRAQGTVLSTAEGYNYAGHAVLGALVVNLGTPEFEKYCRAQAAATRWLASRGNPISQQARKLLKAAERDPTVRELMSEVHDEFLGALSDEQSRLARWALPSQQDLRATCAMLLAKILWDMDLGNVALAKSLRMLGLAADREGQSNGRRINEPERSSVKSSPADSEPVELSIDDLGHFLIALVLEERASVKVCEAAATSHHEVNPIEACVLDFWVVIHCAWQTLRPTLSDTTCTAVLDRMRLAALQQLIDDDELTCTEADAVQELEERRYAEYDDLVYNRTPTQRLGAVMDERLHNGRSRPPKDFLVMTRMGMTLLAEMMGTATILKDIKIC